MTTNCGNTGSGETHVILGSWPSWEYGVARGVNRDKDLRPHSPLAREDLKPLGSEWSFTYVTCNVKIYAIILLGLK